VAALARDVSLLWNSGCWDAALARLPELAALAGANPPAVGISWRRPVPSPGPGLTAFPVSPRDSVYVADFEVDWRMTRRFFCTIALEGDGVDSRLSVNYSTDLGRTWSEVYLLSGYSYRLNDVTGRSMRDHYWLAYTGGQNSAPNHALWSRKFRVSDGSADTFRNGNNSFNFFNAPALDTVRELAMVSNQITANATIYLLALMASDSLCYFTMPVTNDTAWRVTKLAFTNAAAGLDACWNDDCLTSDTALLYVSYVGRGDSVCVLRMKTGGVWERIRAVAAEPAGYITSVAAHRDTAIVFYSDDGLVRYQIRRGGAAWAVGSPPQDTTERNTLPDVHGEGGFFHVVYRANTGCGWYTRRPYSGYTWEQVRRFDDNGVVAYNVKPDVRWIGRADTAGVVWGGIVSGPGARALYSCFDYAGVSEPGPGLPVPGFSARPTRTGVTIRYSLDRPGPATLRACDIAGRVLHTWSLTASAGAHELHWSTPGTGVRFLQLQTADRFLTARVSLVR
jgi:hypothetical protein